MVELTRGPTGTCSKHAYDVGVQHTTRGAYLSDALGIKDAHLNWAELERYLSVFGCKGEERAAAEKEAIPENACLKQKPKQTKKKLKPNKKVGWDHCTNVAGLLAHERMN